MVVVNSIENLRDLENGGNEGELVMGGLTNGIRLEIVTMMTSGAVESLLVVPVSKDRAALGQ